MVYQDAVLTPGPSFATAAQALLQALGITPTPVNTALVVAWEWAEWGGTNDITLTNNPLADELAAPGSTDWNSAGVQVYPSLAVGAAANAQTLRGFPTLVQALANSDPATFFGATGMQDLADWAGGPGNPNYGYAQQVAGNFQALGGQVAAGGATLVPVVSGPVVAGIGGVLLGLVLLSGGIVEEERTAVR